MSTDEFEQKATSTSHVEVKEDYENDTFEEVKQHDANDMDEDKYADDEYDKYEEDEPFIEEEVDSIPEHDLTSPSLTIVRQNVLTSLPPSSSSSLSSLPSLGGSSKSQSSLPSLGGLPSITGGSSSLTPAGRAHFAQASVFGRANATTAGANGFNATTSMTNGATPKAVPTEATPSQRAAYKASNLIFGAESFGIHPVTVTESGTPAYVRVDDGHLVLWAGMVGTELNGPNSTNAPLQSSFGAAPTIFLRGALCDSSRASQAPDFEPVDFAHIFIDPTHQPKQLVDEDGAPTCELPNCYGVKRIGPYRFRVIAQESSLPDDANNYDSFVSTVHRLNEQGSTSQSAFDTQPITTLFVAVEKIDIDQNDSSDSSTSSSRHASSHTTTLPLLPLGESHTFWLSTHQLGPRSTLQFGDSATVTDTPAGDVDSFELTLDLTPLHDQILSQLNIPETPIDEDLIKKSKASSSASHTRHDASSKSRSQKKLDRAKRKKKEKKAALTVTNQMDDVQLSTLVYVDTQLSTDHESKDVIRVNIHPSSSSRFSTDVPSAFSPSSSLSSSSPPSLADLLSTLAVSSSSSLPTSILGHDQTLAQLATLTSQVTRTANASESVSESRPKVSHATVGGAHRETLPTNPVPSSSSSHLRARQELVRTRLDHRTSWAWNVELSAMRLSQESEGHVTFDSLDLLHNQRLKKNPRTIMVGDHQVELLRTVGLLCDWSSPNDGSTLSQPVLVSQTPLISYHIHVRLTRIDSEEARDREFDAILG